MPKLGLADNKRRLQMGILGKKTPTAKKGDPTMVLAKWNGALVVAIAWAGLAWGQSAAPAQPAAESPAQPVTVTAPAATASPVPIIKSVEGLSPMPSEHAAKQESPSAVANIPVVNDKAPLSGAKLGPIETETAKPSDWHRSW